MRTKQQKLLYYNRPWFQDKLKETLEEIEERVAWLLAKYPKLKNSDKLLVNYYHVIFDNWKGQLDDINILSLANPASIVRSRRYLQNDLGLFRPDTEIEETRDAAQTAYHDYYVKGEGMVKGYCAPRSLPPSPTTQNVLSSNY